MHANNKHRVIQFGVWTVVVNDTPFFILEWLPNAGTVASQLWAIARSLLLPPGIIVESPKQEDTVEGEVTEHGDAIETRTFSYLLAFVKEIYRLGPIYLFADLAVKVWYIIQGSLQLYFTSRILGLITQFLESQELDIYTILGVIACRIMVSVAGGIITKKGFYFSSTLQERVTYHFLTKTMHTALNFDLTTAEDPEVQSKLSNDTISLTYQRSGAWEAYDSLSEILFGFSTILSEMSLILGLSRSSSTFTLAILLCLVGPICSILEQQGLYSHSFVSFCSNPHFARMAALHNLAFDKRFREDRLSNNYGPYIEREFKRSKDALGDTYTESEHIQWWKSTSAFMFVMENLSSEISLIFFALRVLWDHKSVTMADLILLQQTTRSIQYASSTLIYRIKSFSSHLLTVRNLYSLPNIPNKVKDGDLPYPRTADGKPHSGAEVEFRDVSFKYPGTDRNALTNLSFTIKPGQLVVIVGVNGSGKSSTIKLLTRLHDPSDGQIFLDGLPLTSYNLADLRRTTAILRQDHSVLPLSLRENIALGLPERDVTESEVQDAILQGGAERFLKKLKNGADTILEPVKTTRTHFVGDTDKALKSVVDEKEKKTDLSGGETQRLSASRTFMRLMGGNIRLLAADEPTSALDPEGEFELFTRLRKHSGGKTVIFITHRFGHLTKYADLILCLKDGRLVEQGTHEALMASGGEYKRLHNVQAQAFTSVS